MTKSDKDEYEIIETPAHYGGDGPYEVFKVLIEWGQEDYHVGSAIKYLARAGKKPGSSMEVDLRKARRHLDFKIEQLEKENANA